MGTASRVAFVLLGVAACGDNAVPQTRIVGQMFTDDNGNGIRDEGEAPIAGAAVYVNLDDNQSIDASEPRTRTAADGTYELIVDGPGTYEVHAMPPFGRRAAGNAQKRGTGPANIIGGSDAGAGDYGFMISLAARFESFTFPTCGGVLITDRHVLTAAHCSVGEVPSEVAIIAGSLDLVAGGLVVDVSKIVTHPSYDFDPANGYDVAVWTLAEPIDLAATGLSTIEMLGDATAMLADPDVLATTIGWGTSDRDSSLLQQVHVPLVSAEDCAVAYPDSTRMETQICAGAIEGGIDSCQGDSGGPLLVRDPDRQVWLHAGITSYGNGCGVAGSPGVYARTSALAEWVMEHAVEPGTSQRVTIAGGTFVATADFPTFATTRPQVGAIPARWQATGTTLPTTTFADMPVTARWSILSDEPTLDGFTCHFQTDLLDAGSIQEVPCGLGETQHALPQGFPTGIFATALTVSRDGIEFRRRADVVSGNPATVVEKGELSPDDPTDPDFSFATYHLDYYEITGLSGTRAFAIEGTTSAFFMYLALYDLDQRDFQQGGGTLDVAQFVAQDKVRLVVVPEPGRRYLIGVSSFEVDGVGSYTLSLLNDGALTAR